MPDASRDEYLATIADLLPFPPERRAEIVEEIAGHLDDLVAERAARGSQQARAEAEAQARMGSPVELARDLARPEQSAMRLLAAAGAGVRSGIGNWLYGYLLGAMAIFLLTFVLVGAVQLLGGVLGTGWRLEFTDQGWNSLLLAGAVAVGLFFAGRAVVRAVSVSSRRLTVDVRPWVALVLTILAAWICVFVVTTPHNAASAVAWTLAPGAVVLGAYRPTLLPHRVRLSYTVIGVFALLAIAIGVGTAASGLHQSTEVGRTPHLPDRGLSHIGPVWDIRADGPGLVTGNGWGSNADAITWSAEVHSATAIARFSDLRLEAWRTERETFDIDQTRSGPFAVAPVDYRDGMLHAEIVTTRDPEGGFWELVLTGVARDGTRYVLDAGNGGNSTFEGTAFDWIVASAAD